MKVNQQKKAGKIACADALLLSGQYTKPEVARTLCKMFRMKKGVAVNTVNWAASTMPRRILKRSNHKPSPRANEVKL
jgi:hypothetical protein